MLHLLQMGPFKVLTTLLLIQNSWQLPLMELPLCCVPASSGDNTCDLLLGLLQLVYLHCSIWLPLLMQHFHPNLAFRSFISLPPILHLLPLLPHYCPLLLAVSLHLLLPLPLLTPLGFFNRMLVVSESQEH